MNELPIYQKYSAEMNAQFGKMSMHDLLSNDLYLDLKNSASAVRKRKLSSITEDSPGATGHTSPATWSSNIMSPAADASPCSMTPSLEEDVSPRQCGAEEEQEGSTRKRFRATVRSMWTAHVKPHLHSKLSPKELDGQEEDNSKLEEKEAHNAAAVLAENHQLFNRHMQAALDKSYPFHDSDLENQPSVATTLDDGMAKTKESELPMSSPILPPQDVAAGSKIKIDPLSQMVYFDTSSSRRAFSLIRANEVTPVSLVKGPANTYSGRSSDRSTRMRRSRRRNANTLLPLRSKRHLHQKQQTQYQPNKYATVGPLFWQQDPLSGSSSNSSGAGTLSSSPLQIPSVRLSAKPVLRSKVNTNSEQELERLVKLKAERAAARARHRYETAAAAVEKQTGESDDDDGDYDYDGTGLRERQYPHGSKSSVKELYSAMRKAQVAGYQYRVRL